MGLSRIWCQRGEFVLECEKSDSEQIVIQIQWALPI